MELGYNFLDKSIAWTCTIVLAIIVGLIFLKQSRTVKKESDVVSRIKKGYSVFLLGWAATRIFFLFSDYEKLLVDDQSLLYTRFLLTGYVLMIVAMSWLVWAIESRMQGSHALPLTKFLIVASIVLGVLWVVAIFNADVVTVARSIAYIIGTVLGLVVIIFYIRLAVQATGTIRKRVFLNFLAFVLIFLGHTLDSQWVVNWIKDVIWVPAVISAAGVICFYMSQKQEK